MSSRFTAGAPSAGTGDAITRIPGIIALAVIVLLLGEPRSAAAHHAFAAHFLMDTFDEVEGRVTEIEWVNPHVRIFVEDADEQIWEVEAGPVNLLTRMGIEAETIAVGDRIRARGNPGRRDSHVLWVSNVLLADNTEILANPRAEPYWEGRTLGDARVFFDSEGLTPPDDGERSLFRIWSPLIERFPRPLGDPSLTAAGEAAQADYGIDNQVVGDCELLGVPFVMMSPYPIELVDRGDRILIRAELFDLERTAWLEPLETPPEPSALGYSLARFDNDALVIETTNIDFHSYGDLGPAQSSSSHVVERFALSDDGLELDYEITVTDPVMLAEPWLWGGTFVYREDAELKPWNCGESLR